MNINLDQWGSFLTQLVVIIGGLAGLGYWFRGWVKKVATSTEESATQLRTSNGKTIANYTEEMHAALTNLIEVKQNHEHRITTLEILEQRNSSRLDDHLKGHG